MLDLPARDLQDVIEISHRALECDSMERLREQTLELMERSLGARSGIFARFNKTKKDIEIVDGTEHGVPQGAMALWCSTYHSADPFMKRYLSKLANKPNNIILSNEVISHKDYVASSFYQHFMKPQSIYHVMIIGLKTDDHEPIGVFGLHRPIHAPAFSAREAAKASLIAPHLKGAFQRVMARETLQESRWVADTFAERLASDGIAVIDQEMNTLFISNSAQDLLGCGATLPEPLILECRRVLSEHNGCREGVVDFYFAQKNRRVKAELSSTGDHGTAPRYILRLDARSTTAPVTADMWQRMKQLGLSRREMDVAQLTGMGLTSMLIADKLNISVRTVNNHLRSIYQKIGVHNRTSLMFRLSNGQQ